MPTFAKFGRIVLLAILTIGIAIRTEAAGPLTTPLLSSDFDNSAARMWLDGAEAATPVPAVTVFQAQTARPTAFGSAAQFGNSTNAGPRHIRFGFNRPLTIGSMLVLGDVEPSALSATATYPGSMANEADWVRPHRLKLTAIDPSTRLSTTELTVWVFTEPVQTRGLRFTKVARETDTAYSGRIAGVYLFTERLANVAPQAELFTTGNEAAARFMIDESGAGTSGPRWDNGASGGANVVSPEFPERVIFSWPTAVRLSGLCFYFTGFTEGFVQRFIGSDTAHPRDAADADWETITAFSNLRWQGPTRNFGIEMLDFGQVQTSRAFRVVITRAADPAIEPALGTTTFGGKKVWLNEALALFNLAADPLPQAIVARACDLPAPIAIPFHLDQAGYVTLVIEDSQGRRVRNLVGETFFQAGDQVVFWDGLDESGRVLRLHGEYELVQGLVAAGTYRVRGLVRDQLNLRYEFTVNNSGLPPWLTSDVRSAWLSDHRPPADVLYLPINNEMLLVTEVGEASPHGLLTDLSGRKTRSLGPIEEGFYLASHLAQDRGPSAPANIGAYSAVLSRNKLYVHSMTTNRVFTRILMRDFVVSNFIGGLAAWNRNVYLSVPSSNVIHVIDAVAATVSASLTVENPRGLAFDTDGRLLVVSGTTVKRYTVETSPHALANEVTLVAEGLEDPQRLFVHGATGNFYVSLWGNVNQVKVYGPDGGFIRSIGNAGPLTLGLYNEQQMHRPAGMAVSPDGKLWVAEYDMAPKRVSLWTLDGQFIRAFYGPPKYGGGGRLDPLDKTRFYYTDEDPNDPIPFRIGVEFRLDWEDGSSMPHAVYARGGTNVVDDYLPTMPPETAVYLNGHQYMLNTFNGKDIGGIGTIAGVWKLVDNVAKPVAAAGLHAAWPLLQQAPYHNGGPVNAQMFMWSDLNDDFRVQPNEVQFRTQIFTTLQFTTNLVMLTGHGLRAAPTGFTPNGAPIYNLAAAASAIGTITERGSEMLEGQDGWHVLTGGPMRGFKDGVLTWTYPSQWPSLHASQNAPSSTIPRPPGMMIGTTRVLGTPFTPGGGEAGQIWSINGNKGDMYLLTMDGLFIGRLFNDGREAPLWAMPPIPRGTLLNDISLSEETFWPSITKTADGEIYLVAGDNHSSIVRVGGLESIRRLPQTTIEVTNELLAQCVEYRSALAACEVVNPDRLTVAQPTTPPTLDGDLAEWAAANMVMIDSRATGAVMVAQGRLYAAWRTESATLPNNSGAQANALFKTGGALDLMIGTDPAASPTRAAAVAGDIRLTIARVNNTTRALLYRPVAANPNPVTFTSPVRSITFARIDDVSADVQFAGAGGRFEISVPLTTLGLNPAPGLEIRGDIGVLRGQDNVTVQRSYWHNESTGLVSDTPTESELTPRLWGRWVFEEGTAPPLAVTTSSPLPGGQVGSSFSVTLQATGGTPDYSWSIVAGGGTLPQGLSLSPLGLLSGTPSAAGTFNFTARVTDSLNVTATRQLSITVTPPPLVITTSAALPAGQVAEPYSHTLQASGGTPGYTWSVTAGTLPDGLVLSPAGALTGTPNAAGTFGFTVRVADSANVSTTRAMTLIINPPGVAIVTVSLPNATQGAAYSQTLAASGGTPGYQWTIEAGALPNGLALSAAGQISGTPTVHGTFEFTVRLTDSASATQTRALTLVVAPPPLLITTGSLPGGTVSSAYNVTLAASGGVPAYTWSLASGALPPGLTLSAAGVISGTPTAHGTFNFSARVQDTENASVTRSLSIVVAPAPLVISTTSLPAATVTLSYSQTIAATGGVSPRTFSISAGALPGGLSLSAAGVISGTPVAEGTFNFTVRVTDSLNTQTTRALSILVNPPPLAVATQALAGGTVGAQYSRNVSASGGVAPYSWTLGGGALPAGLSLSAGGVISGAPTTHGTFNFTVRVTDAVNSQASGNLSIVISPPALVIETTSLPGATVGTDYSATLAASGGVAPYTWTVSAGTLPNGLSLSAGGVFSGTPAIQGTFNFSVRAQDSLGAAQTRSLSIAVTPAPLVITTDTLPNGVVATPYSQTLAATGGVSPYTWSVSAGATPVGVALAANGALSGTPSANGTFNFTARVTDSAGVAQTRAFSIVIAPPPLAVATESLPNGVVGSIYSQTLAASGGSPPYSWLIFSGTVPPGLSFSAGGVLSGTPTTRGNFTFTAQVRDSLGTAVSRALTVRIDPPPVVIETTGLPDAVRGAAYSESLRATGGVDGYTWSVAAGALPPGISLDANGVFSGAATQEGTFSFTARAQDSLGAAATRALTITVRTPGLVITTSNLPTAVQGAAYSQNLLVVGGQGPYTWTITAGALPAGIQLSGGGTLSGTPTAAGTFDFTVHVADSLGTTQTKPLTLVVNPPALTITTTSPIRSVTVNTAATRTLAATGGQPPYTWSLVSGVIPPGMSFDPAGAVTGTPTSPGTYTFLAQVSDSGGRTATREFSILSAPAALIIPPPEPLPAGVVTESYSALVAASGGTLPYTWILNTGTLPPGLAVSSTTGTNGIISGTPTAPGTFNFTLRVRDNNGILASRAFSMTVTVVPPLVVTSSLHDGQVGVAYSATLSGDKGLPPYTWSMADGSLPPGLGIASNGEISGVPTAFGNFSFGVAATDAQGTRATRTLSINVAPAPLVVTTATELPGGQVNESFGLAFAASGGVGGYAWAVVSGQLPPGLLLEPSGFLGGAPEAHGSFVFELEVLDAAQARSSRQFSILIAPARLLVTTETIGTATARVSYLQPLAAEGGVPPYTWALAGGELPSGLSISGSGVVSGTPTSAGQFTFTARVTDSVGVSESRELSMTVAPPPLTITTASQLRSVTVNQNANRQIDVLASDGTAPFTWSLAGGTIPPGMTFSTSGLLSGAATQSGTYIFTVRVEDATGRVGTKEMRIFAAPAALQIPFDFSLAPGVVTENYSNVVYAVGGTLPYQWSPNTGTIPPGLSVVNVSGTNGALVGIPTTPGTFNFTIRVTESSGFAATRAFIMTVGVAPLEMQALDLPPATRGSAFETQFAGRRGVPPYSWSVSGGALPNGLSLAPGGRLSGTPSEAGAFTFTVTLTDAQNTAVSREFQLNVDPGLPRREQWRIQVFGENAGTPMAADNADPDGDLLVNIVEYAFGLNPLTPDPTERPRPEIISVEGASYLAVSHRRDPEATDVQVVIETSPDLNTWSLSVIEAGRDGNRITIRDTVSLNDAGRRYLRVNVVVPQP